MALEKHGVLGQAQPAAATDVALYTCPSNRKATISTLAIANPGAATTYRANLRVNGAALATSNQIAPDVPIDANDTAGITWGIALGPGDILSCRSASGGVTFTAFGVEEDPV